MFVPQLSNEATGTYTMKRLFLLLEMVSVRVKSSTMLMENTTYISVFTGFLISLMTLMQNFSITGSLTTFMIE